MDRREFIKHCAFGTGAMVLSGQLLNSAYAAAGKNPKPNILWLIAEDLSPDLGCYGNTVVKTPNIDKLASQGIRYNNAYTTATVCSPSRSAFMTGMYQTSIGAHQHRSNMDKPLPDNVKVITEYFRQAGYFTSNSKDIDFKHAGKTDFNFKVDKPFDGTDWQQRKPGQPFFSLVNFHATHRVFERDPDNPIDPAKVTIPQYYPDDPITRRDWADYLEFAQILDKHVGIVLDRLDADGLTDNTIIFFFGDHGRPMVRGKQWLYDGGIRVPLIVKWAGNIKPNQVKDDMISAIDFAPTCMSFAGIDIPSFIQGQPFLGPNAKKRDYIIAARDRCDETVDRIRCIRTKQFKYIRNFYPDKPYTQFNAYKKRRYPVLSLMEYLHEKGKLTPAQERFFAPTKSKEELYDIIKDPDEINNLADNPKYKDKLKKFRQQLDQWIEQTNDLGRFPEAPEVIAQQKANFAKDHKRFCKEANLPEEDHYDQWVEYWRKELGLTGSGNKINSSEKAKNKKK